MGFDYRRAKDKYEGNGESNWTAYSDLFMMMSTVFLLLYVFGNLRSTTSSIEQTQEFQRLTQKSQDLQNQIQVYNTLRDNHLKTEASENERQVYEKLMGKLDLLKDQAHQEKEDLQKQAKENEEKEYALNEYQRLIRNIINTNVLAKTQLERRDILIERKNDDIKEQQKVITSQSEKITDLNKDIESKQTQIEQNNNKISQINNELAQKITAIQQQQQQFNLSKAVMDQRIAMITQDSQAKIGALKSQNQQAVNQLNQYQSDLVATKSELENTKEQSEADRKKFQDQVGKMQADAAAREAAAKQAFDNALGKERMSAAEKAQKLAEFEGQARAREKDLQGKISDLAGKFGQAQNALAKESGDKARALASVEKLKGQNQGLTAELAHAQEMANAKKAISEKINQELKKVGLKGKVDGSGAVTLEFGDEYFDTGSANLKPGMVNKIERFIPGYARSLFNDPKLAANIENVEIIGYASSTYKGKYVPPGSLKKEDQDAVKYNLNLSYKRAQSIFGHIFDTDKMTFQHQKELLPKIKVVGRGYLPDGMSSNDFKSGMPEKEFCTKFNCKASQRVIIRFKMKD